MHNDAAPASITAHTTVAAASIAQWVAQHHGLEPAQCHLIRRGLNDNYAVRTADGSRYVVRLYSIRPRGEFNIDFEAALLAHLDAKGAGVAPVVPAMDGRTHIRLRLPEGPRAMALFRHAEGAVPETLEEIEATGRELARIHQAARDYAGPPSRYRLDGQYLAARTLGYLQAHPQMEAPLLDAYRALVHGLLDELAAAEGGLTQAMCHGDTHGFNNHVAKDAAGSLCTVFFDFDDAGPGFLAYDLCVLPWSYLYRKGLQQADEVLRERWSHYLTAYQAAGGAVCASDLAALPLFVQLRHLWNLGEAAGRVHHWGVSAAPLDWLRKQPGVMRDWRNLKLLAA